MGPLISIIVPSYKVEQYIDKCIESICKQSYSNLEIILVDDGSPDNCPGKCDAWATLDSRIKVVHKKNGGLSDARNYGIEIAQGEYIAFVDSDDYIHPEMIERLYHKIENSCAELAVCNFEVVDDSGIAVNELSPIKSALLDREEYISLLHKDRWWYYTTAWNKLYRKQLFEDLRFPVGKVHEDVAIIHYVVEKCSLIVVIEDKLYYYVKRDNSIMSSNHNAIKRMDEVEALIDRYNFYNMKGYNDVQDKLYALILDNYSRYYLSLCTKEKKVHHTRINEMKNMMRSLILNRERKFRGGYITALIILSDFRYMYIKVRRSLKIKTHLKNIIKNLERNLRKKNLF